MTEPTIRQVRLATLKWLGFDDPRGFLDAPEMTARALHLVDRISHARTLPMAEREGPLRRIALDAVPSER